MHIINLLQVLLKFNVEYLQLEVFNYRHLKARLTNIKKWWVVLFIDQIRALRGVRILKNPVKDKTAMGEFKTRKNGIRLRKDSWNMIRCRFMISDVTTFLLVFIKTASVLLDNRWQYDCKRQRSCRSKTEKAWGRKERLWFVLPSSTSSYPPHLCSHGSLHLVTKFQPPV